MRSPQMIVREACDRIPVYPPLQIGIIEPVEVIIHAAVDVDFFAGEAIDIGSGQGATGRDRVAIRAIAVAGRHRLAAVDHVRDIAVPIGEIIVVVGPVAGGIAVGTRQQPADPSGAFQAADQVVARRPAR